jgi:RNA polymerase sigma-70 factor (ECF subfamily)
VGDDGELVARLQAGDEDAFATLVRQYQPRLLRVARGLVDSAAVAEEVVQDTWLAVVCGVGRFEERSSLRTWLFRILVNRARSTGSREHRSAPVGDDVEEVFDRVGAWAVPPTPWPELADDRIVAVGLARKVHAALPELPAGLREVVVLRDVEGLSSAEVATALGITDGHQRVMLHRARTRLRRRLAADVEAG